MANHKHRSKFNIKIKDYSDETLLLILDEPKNLEKTGTILHPFTKAQVRAEALRRGLLKEEVWR